MAALDAIKARRIFDEYMADVRYKKSTIDNKRAYLLPFFGFLQEKGIRDLRDVDQALIREYLEAQARAVSLRSGKPYSPSSLLLFHGAVKLLFTALSNAELILRNPALEVAFRPGQRNRLRAVFTEEEIARFLDSIDVNRRLGLRDRAMFELMYSSGLRSGELGKLDRGDVDLAARMLIVRDAKWSKDRMVPISGVASRFLSLYLGPGGDSKRPVFLGQNGRIGCACVGKRFRLHLAAAGLTGKGLTAHSIRHATATHLLAHGADLRYVQELLGHESIETTVVYTNELFENLKRIYRRFHPRENDLYREVDEDYLQRLSRLRARLENPRRLSRKRWMDKEDADS